MLSWHLANSERLKRCSEGEREIEEQKMRKSRKTLFRYSAMISRSSSRSGKRRNSSLWLSTFDFLVEGRKSYLGCTILLGTKTWSMDLKAINWTRFLSLAFIFLENLPDNLITLEKSLICFWFKFKGRDKDVIKFTRVMVNRDLVKNRLTKFKEL